jgi:electron transfer flavoprotein alpha subunit
MSVLVYASSTDGKFKKSTFEVVSYGKKVATLLGTDLVALTINADDASELQRYGAEKILTVHNEQLSVFNAKAYALSIQQVAESNDANVVVIDSSADGLYIAPLLAVGLDAGYASNVIAVPETTDSFTVKRKAFSKKIDYL